MCFIGLQIIHSHSKVLGSLEKYVRSSVISYVGWETNAVLCYTFLFLMKKKICHNILLEKKSSKHTVRGTVLFCGTLNMLLQRTTTNKLWTFFLIWCKITMRWALIQEQSTYIKASTFPVTGDLEEALVCLILVVLDDLVGPPELCRLTYDVI